MRPALHDSVLVVITGLPLLLAMTRVAGAYDYVVVRRRPVAVVRRPVRRGVVVVR